MRTLFLVEPGGHSLSGVALGVADDGDGAEGDADGEEAVDDLQLREHLLVPQYEHLVLQADKVDVLVEQLQNLLHRMVDMARSSRRCRDTGKMKLKWYEPWRLAGRQK